MTTPAYILYRHVRSKEAWARAAVEALAEDLDATTHLLDAAAS